MAHHRCKRRSPRARHDRPLTARQQSPYEDATRFLWGDEESGQVADWIYASTDLIHMLVYALAPGGRCLHSDTHRTVFGADVTYFVLEGTLVLANPERGEVKVVEPGEAVLFRRDTWHHIFSHGLEQLRRARVLRASSIHWHFAEVRADTATSGGDPATRTTRCWDAGRRSSPSRRSTTSAAQTFSGVATAMRSSES